MNIKAIAYHTAFGITLALGIAAIIGICAVVTP